VISFIFSDRFGIQILNINRKYYGRRMMVFLFITSYAAMASAGLLVELLFGGLCLIPAKRVAIVAAPQITLNYTSVLNIIFLALALGLVVRAIRTGVGPMLAMMDEPPPSSEEVAVAPASADGEEAYVCPMHPEVRRGSPGRCPKCGMALEPKQHQAH